MGAKNYYKLRNTLKNKEFNENHRRILRHFCLANVAILFGLIVSIPSSFARRWIFSGFVCKVAAFEGFVSGMTNINLLVVMAIERYYNTKKGNPPINYVHLINLSWLVGLFWSVLPLIGFGSYSLEPHRTACSLKMVDNSPNHGLFVLSLVFVGFLLPVCVGLVFHVLTWNLENRRNLKISPHERSMNNATRKVFFIDLAAWSFYLFLALTTLYGGTESKLTLWLSYMAPLAIKIVVAVIPWLYPRSI